MDEKSLGQVVRRVPDKNGDGHAVSWRFGLLSGHNPLHGLRFPLQASHALRELAFLPESCRIYFRQSQLAGHKQTEGI